MSTLEKALHTKLCLGELTIKERFYGFTLITRYIYDIYKNFSWYSYVFLQLWRTEKRSNFYPTLQRSYSFVSIRFHWLVALSCRASLLVHIYQNLDQTVWPKICFGEFYNRSSYGCFLEFG